MSEQDALYARTKVLAAKGLRAGRPVVYRDVLIAPTGGRMTWEAAYRLIEAHVPDRPAGAPAKVGGGEPLSCYVGAGTASAIRAEAVATGRRVADVVRGVLEERFGR